MYTVLSLRMRTQDCCCALVAIGYRARLRMWSDSHPSAQSVPRNVVGLDARLGTLTKASRTSVTAFQRHTFRRRRLCFPAASRVHPPILVVLTANWW